MGKRDHGRVGCLGKLAPGAPQESVACLPAVATPDRPSNLWFSSEETWVSGQTTPHLEGGRGKLRPNCKGLLACVTERMGEPQKKSFAQIKS